MVKRKNKLVVEPFDDIKIIGINTTMMDYQLAWHLNKTLKTELVKYKSITSNGEDFFSFYLYDAGENSNAYNLVSLSSSEGKEWVSFKPKTDFLFIIRNYIKESDFQSILTNINSIQNVFHAYVVDLEYNKKIDVILEDIEFHEMDIIDEINKSLRNI
ncbi:MAG: IPExxxVDY family protein [Bacteroidales bacterium]|nr:IPExxxVDY family protein [Bacteroidales bacterium]